jgi:hypothetical protein
MIGSVPLRFTMLSLWMKTETQQETAEWRRRRLEQIRLEREELNGQGAVCGEPSEERADRICLRRYRGTLPMTDS